MATDNLASFVPIPPSDYVTNDDEATICTKRVEEYDDSLPSIESFLHDGKEKTKRYTIYTPRKVGRWFEDILSGDARLVMMGGASIGSDQSNALRCEFCLKEQDPQCGEPRPGFKRCIRAPGEGGDINVCEGCFVSKSLKPFEPRDASVFGVSEEYAEKINKKDLQDHKRREDLMRQYLGQSSLGGDRGWTFEDIPQVASCFWCSASSLVVSGLWRDIDTTSFTSLCGDCASFLQNSSTKTAKVCQELVCRRVGQPRAAPKEGSCWSLFRRTGVSDTYSYVGVCDECKEVALSAPTREITFDQTYGSIMEWIPILEDENLHTLLYNMAKGSKRYHNVAVMTFDDHGRAGFHFIAGTLEDALKEFAQLQAAYETKYPEGEETWKSHFSSPLCRMATVRGKEVQLG